MKSTAELKKKKEEILARKDEILAKAKEEKRALSAEEQVEIREMQLDLADVNIQLADLNTINFGIGRSVDEKREKFSLRRAIANTVEGRAHHEADAKLMSSSSKERFTFPLSQRGVLAAGTDAQGGHTIEEEKTDILLPLQDKLVLVEAGAKFMTGLKGNITMPSYSGSTVKWEEELATAKDGAGDFSTKTFKPKRISGYIDISKQLLAQDTLGVERIIRESLASAIALKLEATILGSHESTAVMPDGLFTTLPAAGGVLDFDKLVALETSIDTQNALTGNLKYIMHPALIGKAKTTVKKEKGAVGFILENGTINGYPVLRTNAIASKLQEGSDEYGVAFGNWADYFIGQWGDVELVIDNITKATENQVRLVINAFFDTGMIRKESFATTTLK